MALGVPILKHFRVMIFSVLDCIVLVPLSYDRVFYKRNQTNSKKSTFVSKSSSSMLMDFFCPNNRRTSMATTLLACQGCHLSSTSKFSDFSLIFP